MTEMQECMKGEIFDSPNDPNEVVIRIMQHNLQSTSCDEVKTMEPHEHSWFFNSNNWDLIKKFNSN